MERPVIEDWRESGIPPAVSARVADKERMDDWRERAVEANVLPAVAAFVRAVEALDEARREREEGK